MSGIKQLREEGDGPVRPGSHAVFSFVVVRDDSVWRIAVAHSTLVQTEGGDAVTRWIKQMAHPIDSSDPEAPLDDLLPLQGWIEGAVVVGLGESVRGVRSGRQLYQLKHRFLRLLVEHHGFRAVALEDTPTVGAALDEYVATGQGDTQTPLASAWRPWRTEEFRTTLQWLRAYNAARPEDPVRIVGVDGGARHALAHNTLAYQARTGRRVVYWGGMGHVAVSPGQGASARVASDGAVWRHQLGAGYLPIGFVCHHSSGPELLPPPPDHFVESMLDKAGLEIYALDLRQDPQTELVRGWLNGPAITRLIGPRYDPDRDADFSMTNASLRRWFDVLVYVRDITPAHYLI